MAESRRDLLCCGICRQLLRNPATLPCGHSFCMQCITCSLNHNERNKSSCRCPECGRMFPSRPQLNKNTTVAQKRPWRCMETEGPSCWKHQCPLDVYCCTDEQVICATCASVDHRGHTIGLVREERKRKQEQMMMMKRKSKKLIQRQEEKLINNGEILKQIEEKARETDDYCESILAGVIDSLQKHYLSVRELISTLGEKTAAQVQTNMKNLELKKKAMKTRYAELDQLAQTDSDVHFLLKWSSQCYDVQADHFHVSSDPLLPFVSIKTAVEKLGSQLEALCDKEFGAIVQTVRNESQQEFRGGTEEEEMQQRHEAATPESYDFSEVSSTQTQPTVEPKTREEFLRLPSQQVLGSRERVQTNCRPRNPQGRRLEVPLGASWVHHHRPNRGASGSTGERASPVSQVAGSISGEGGAAGGKGALQQNQAPASTDGLSALLPSSGGVVPAASSKQESQVSYEGHPQRQRRPPAWSQDYQMSS